jgi:hypothetical protein
VLKGAHDSGLCVLQNTHTLLSIHLDILNPQLGFPLGTLKSRYVIPPNHSSSLISSTWIVVSFAVASCCSRVSAVSLVVMDVWGMRYGRSELYPLETRHVGQNRDQTSGRYQD